MRRLLLSLLLAFPLRVALADALWQTLPSTPPPVAGEHTGLPRSMASASTMRRSATAAGGVAARWPRQLRLLGASGQRPRAAPHGDPDRQPRPRPQHAGRATYGYDLMADDVVALLDTLRIAKADVVGWSDGGILGIDLAIRHPDRVGRSSPSPPTR